MRPITVRASSLVGIGILSLLLAGCNSNDFAKTNENTQILSSNVTENQAIPSYNANVNYSNVIQVDKIKEKRSIRALAKTDSGELQLVSYGEEKIGHINTPSVLGNIGDYYYHGNYAVLYKHEGRQQEVLKIKELTVIQPTNQPFSFIKMSLETLDLYFLVPERAASRGHDVYVFGMDKGSEEIFPILFKKGEKVKNTINYEKNNLPIVKGGKLVVTTHNVEDNNVENSVETTEYTFDDSNNQFIGK